MLIDLYLQGRIPLDAFVSEEIAIGGIETAFDKMHRGDVLRSVVIMENADRAGLARDCPDRPHGDVGHVLARRRDSPRRKQRVDCRG